MYFYFFIKLFYYSFITESGSKDLSRAETLMRLERDLFSRWCNLVFRGGSGTGPIRNFEDGLDKVITSSYSSQCLVKYIFLFLMM